MQTEGSRVFRKAVERFVRIVRVEIALRGIFGKCNGASLNRRFSSREDFPRDNGTGEDSRIISVCSWPRIDV